MIFFDNNATTPLLPEVAQVVMDDLKTPPGNPSSITAYGRAAKSRLIQARHTITEKLHLQDKQLLFTSGATEANHLLIHGYYKKRPGHIVSTRAEHSSVTLTLESLRAPITYAHVGEKGHPSPSDILAAIRPDTTMLVFSYINSETGALYPIEEIAEIAIENDIILIVDAVAALGKVPISRHPGITALSFSAHKCHGPKGVGFAAFSKSQPPAPLFLGGKQELGLRAGTENVTGILAMAEAIRLIPGDPYSAILPLRETFERSIKEHFPAAQINAVGPRGPNTSNFYFPEIDAESLLILLDQKGLICSMGSACSSGALEPSHVLLQMGYSQKRALSSLRFSFSRLNTPEEVKEGAKMIAECLAKLSPAAFV